MGPAQPSSGTSTFVVAPPYVLTAALQAGVTEAARPFDVAMAGRRSLRRRLVEGIDKASAKAPDEDLESEELTEFETRFRRTASARQAKFVTTF